MSLSILAGANTHPHRAENVKQNKHNSSASSNAASDASVSQSVVFSATNNAVSKPPASSEGALSLDLPSLAKTALSLGAVGASTVFPGVGLLAGSLANMGGALIDSAAQGTQAMSAVDSSERLSQTPAQNTGASDGPEERLLRELGRSDARS